MMHSSCPKSYSQRSQIDKQIEATEQKVQALLKELRELRGERNGLAPIHRLPIDVLAQIFHHTELTPWLCTPWLILLTSVCHHWRAVISSYPMLWTTIACKHNGQLKLALKRSGNALISLELRGRLNGTHYLNEETARIIYPHLYRIKVLILDLNKDRYNTMVSFPVSFPLEEGVELPALRVLKSCGREFFYSDFSTYAYNLVTFKSRRDSFDWPTHPVLPSSLVELAIIKPSTSISVSDLIQVLQSLPRLSHLETESCLDYWEDEELEDGGRDAQLVSLPSLRWLAMREALNETLVLFSRLALPAHVSIKVAIIGKFTPGVQGGILTAIEAAQERNQLYNASCKSLTGLSLTDAGIVSATFKVAPGKDDHDGNRELQSASWNINTFPTISLLAVSLHWDLSRLTSLKIDGPRLWKKKAQQYECWIQSFGDLPNLQVLKLDEYSTPLFRLYIMEEKSQTWCNLSDSQGNLLGTDPPLSNPNNMQALNSPICSQYTTTEAGSRLEAEGKARAMGLKFCALRKLSMVTLSDQRYRWETVPALWDLADFLSLRENLGVGIEKLVYQGAEDWMQSQLKKYVRSVFV